MPILVISLAVIATNHYFFKEETKTINIRGHIFKVRVAKNYFTQTKGLSGLKSLKDNEGMLFVFSSPQKRTFWMKDMNFDLDIIFIRNNEIVEIATLNKPSNSIPSYSSQKEADKVLEINAGLCEKLNIKAGDKISY